MERIRVLVLVIPMISICLGGCLGPEDGSETGTPIDNMLQLMMDEDDLSSDWHKENEMLYNSTYWQGFIFRENGRRDFMHY